MHKPRFGEHEVGLKNLSLGQELPLLLSQTQGASASELSREQGCDLSHLGTFQPPALQMEPRLLKAAETVSTCPLELSL